MRKTKFEKPIGRRMYLHYTEQFKMFNLKRFLLQKKKRREDTLLKSFVISPLASEIINGHK